MTLVPAFFLFSFAAQAPTDMPWQGIGFVENRGQWPEEVRFHARSGMVQATLVRDGLVLAGPLEGAAEGEGVAVKLLFGSDPVSFGGLGELPTLHHFLNRDEPVTHVPAFEAAVLVGVAPGVDVAVRPDGALFAYDLLVAPGADLQGVVLTLEGARGATLAADGSMVLDTPLGMLVQRMGDCWQVEAGSQTREMLTGRFVRLEAGDGKVRYGVDVLGRDPSRALVVDPTLMFATYLGGPASEQLRDMAVAPNGAVFLLSQWGAGMFTTPGVFQPEYLTGTSSDAWVGKLAPSGGQLEWATYLGGSASDQPAKLAMSTSGQVVVVGKTWSPNFPLTPGAYMSSLVNDKSDAFVTRLAGDGSHLLASTLFGGNGQDSPSAVALFPNGDIAVAIDSSSTNLVATSGAFDEVQDPNDILLLRFAHDLSQVHWATWLQISRINSIVIDAASCVFVGGDSAAATGPLPTTAGAFQESLPPGGATKAGYIAKFDPTGSTLLVGTYLGGGLNSDTVWGIDVDAAGAIYAVGQTSSDDFPTTPGAFSNVKSGSGDGFASKLLPDGSGLVWSTFIGGCCGGGGYLTQARVDPAGNLVAVGTTNEPNWPTTPDALQPSYIGGFPSSDVVLSKFSADGASLVYSTHLGGDSTDSMRALGLDAVGRAYVAFSTLSEDIATTPGAVQGEHSGASMDFAVMGLDLGLLPWRVKGGQSQAAPHIPNLSATGAAAPGAATKLSLRGGKPGGLAWLLLGTGELNLPLVDFGIQLYPTPDFSVPVTLGSNGEANFEFTWPAGPGDLHFQILGFDPAAPGWIYASNGLRSFQG
ncbi:MAG: hypothetical protein GC161_13050 [Planctomycetaceae bacterium]|nr:hypothetical protein [Planctomycetaceae bacterium]